MCVVNDFKSGEVLRNLSIDCFSITRYHRGKRARRSMCVCFICIECVGRGRAYISWLNAAFTLNDGSTHDTAIQIDSGFFIILFKVKLWQMETRNRRKVYCVSYSFQNCSNSNEKII